METAVSPLVTFSVEFDDRTAFEIEEKGVFDHAVVTLVDGSRYRLHFYDPSRLEYELKAEERQGSVCVAEPGLVVIPPGDKMQYGEGRQATRGERILFVAYAAGVQR